MIEACYEAEFDGVTARDKDNGNGLGRGFSHPRKKCSVHDDDTYLSANKVSGERWPPVGMALRPALLDDNVAALKCALARQRAVGGGAEGLALAALRLGTWRASDYRGGPDGRHRRL